MKNERNYERLRMEFLHIYEDDIVTTSPPFSEGAEGGEDGGTTLPPIFD